MKETDRKTMGEYWGELTDEEKARMKHMPLVMTTKKLFKKYDNDAGFDIESVENRIVLAQNYVSMVHTDVKVDIPTGYFGLIKERSGMASKGIFVMGGVIDSGYRGEIMVNLANASGKDFEIRKGDRIAQIIILPCSAFMSVGTLRMSERGTDGFGSTGR